MSVIFDQLGVSDSGKNMKLVFHVDTASYFSNVYLENITIVTADKVSKENIWEPPTENYIYKKKYDSTIDKSDNLIIPWNDPNLTNFTKTDFSSDLFFVYVKTTPVTDPCCPCAEASEYTLVVTFDINTLYQNIMNYTKALGNDCQVPNEFIDLILLWNSFKAAVETEHYLDAIKFYNLLFGKASDDPDLDGSHSPYGYVLAKPSKNCGCHG